MKIKITRYPLVRLPSQMEQALYLIREELKSRRLFLALHEVGLDDCYFQVHLDSLILQSIGIDGSDENFDRYTAIMDKRSKKIEASRESVTRQAFKAYEELRMEKRNLKVNVTTLKNA